MSGTAGYQAGTEANAVILNHAAEATWGTASASGAAWKTIRTTGESLKGTKTRTRPAELNTTGQVSTAVTTQVAAGGGINFALSYGTFDDYLASVLGAAWASDKLVSGNLFTSLYVQKKLAAGLFLDYPGSLVTEAQLNLQQGQMSSGSFTLVSQQETSSTTDLAGAATAAPGGRVMDTIGGFQSLTWSGAAPTGKPKSLQLTLQRQSAAAEYALGSAAAAGMILGQLEVSGTLELYFKSFTEYQAAAAETEAELAFAIGDAAGNAYTFKLPQCVLINPQINASAPNGSVMASFTIEGNPDGSGGNTIEIDRAAAQP